MRHRTLYHQSILAQLGVDIDTVKVDHEFSDSNGGILNATLLHSDSRTGVLIIPGIWYPREAYYKLARDLCGKYNVAVYDQRGHAASSSSFSIRAMVEDVAVVANQWQGHAGLSRIYVAGHSLGGYVCAIASTGTSSDAIAGQILLALPLSLNSTARNVPENLTVFKVYLAGLLKALTPKYRSPIVREYVSFWYPAFRRRPYLFALRADNPRQIVEEIQASTDLTHLGNKISVPTLFIWAGNDRTLGIIHDYPAKYREFVQQIVNQNAMLEDELMPGLCHQFNFDDRHRIMISADNELVGNRIDDFISTLFPGFLS
jgi:pimeloyl-ACP methyl ester carboxylesterase